MQQCRAPGIARHGHEEVGEPGAAATAGKLLEQLGLGDGDALWDRAGAAQEGNSLLWPSGDDEILVAKSRQRNACN